MNNTPAYIAIGLMVLGIFGTLCGAAVLAITGDAAPAGWSLATALLGLLTLTTVRWYERRGG